MTTWTFTLNSKPLKHGRLSPASWGPHMPALYLTWVASNELRLRYYKKETLRVTIYPYDGILAKAP